VPDNGEFVYLTIEDALELYAAIVSGTTVDAAGALRARSTLEGALARPASYAHYERADIALQAAVLAHGIAEGQPFLDGNKRLALVSLLTFLEVSGYRINATDSGSPTGSSDSAAGSRQNISPSRFGHASFARHGSNTELADDDFVAANLERWLA
jgi:death-on-curing family protein